MEQGDQVVLEYKGFYLRISNTGADPVLYLSFNFWDQEAQKTTYAEWKLPLYKVEDLINVLTTIMRLYKDR